jgi:hypothetical protein
MIYDFYRFLHGFCYGHRRQYNCNVFLSVSVFRVFPDFIRAKCVQVSFHSSCFAFSLVHFLFAVLAGGCLLAGPD